MSTYDVLIIGSGPAGLFAAIWLERLGIGRIAVIDRHPYPAGGLLNDGKLNFDERVGIDLEELQIDRGAAQELMGEIRRIFTGFPRCRQVTFPDRNERIEALRDIAREQGAQFIAPEQWHWGTDNGKAAVDYVRSLLKKTDFLLGTEVCSIEKQDDRGDIASSAAAIAKRCDIRPKSCLPRRGAAAPTGSGTGRKSCISATISARSTWESVSNCTGRCMTRSPISCTIRSSSSAPRGTAIRCGPSAQTPAAGCGWRTTAPSNWSTATPSRREKPRIRISP